MKFKRNAKQIAALVLCMITALTLALPAAAAEITYMPDVTAEMSQASYWADLYENADGMRFYVLGFDDLSHYSALNGAKPMYNYLNNYYRQQELMEAIEWMCGKPLPVKCQKNPNLYVYAAKDENAMSVMLLNIHLDSIDHPVLELDREYTEIKCVNCSAEIRGKQIYLSDVQGYGMAAFEVK